jgi:hypothetical protein
MMRTRPTIMAIVLAAAAASIGVVVLLVIMFGWRGLAIGALGVMAALGAYRRWIQPWQHRWGATDQEVGRPMPGDDLIPDAATTTRAITIAAPPEQVWPWLVQLGYGRGGYYGDLPWWKSEQGRGAAASADRGPPETPAPGRGRRAARRRNCDATRGAWIVRSIEPERSLVLFSSRDAGRPRGRPARKPKPRAFFDCSWALVLVPEGERVTRLLVRSRIRWGRPGHSTAPGSLWSATP